MELISDNRSFGGRQKVFRHPSKACDCEMTFGAYLPPQAEAGPVPVLWYLSGLSCTHENAMTKAGLQEHAAQHGLAVIYPDTSPRGEAVSDDAAYDLGQGAGFYVNATRDPWKPNFNMYDYVVRELRSVVLNSLPVQDRHGITGHSMGGHGAITIAIRNAELFDSLSAFAPIAHPTQSDWGRKQLSAYLGPDEAPWAKHDATLLMADKGFDGPVLIDQGAADQFIDLLKPEALANAIASKRQQGTFRMQPGYDHSYFFVSTFMEDHVAFHADALYAR